MKPNFCRIGFKRSSSMIWWCDPSTSLGLRLSRNADVLFVHGCITQICSFYALQKDRAYRMAVRLKTKRKIVNYKFSIVCICHVMSTCHLQFVGGKRAVGELPHMCVMTYWIWKEKVWIWLSCLLSFNIGDLVWSIIFAICAIFLQQKGSNVRNASSGTQNISVAMLAFVHFRKIIGCTGQCFFFYGKFWGWQSSYLTCPPKQMCQTLCASISISHLLMDVLHMWYGMHSLCSGQRCGTIVKHLHYSYCLMNIEFQSNGLYQARMVTVYLQNAYSEFWCCRLKMQNWKGATMLHS